MSRVFARSIIAISWLLNLASFVGFLLLRRRIASPEADSNQLMFHIIRPYKTDTDEAGQLQHGNEAVELDLIARLFAAAHDYGNAKVVIVTNNNDPGLPKIRQIARRYSDIVQVLEAPPMPTGTISGQMFNQKVAWEAIEAAVKDEDILLTTDCDSDLSAKLLRQIARAYEDERVGGVGTYPMYHPAVNWSAMPLSMVINTGLGYLALDTAVRGRMAMVGNLLSVRVKVFRQFGGFDSYNKAEQLVDDMATTAKVLSTGKQIAQVGMMPVWNRYSTWPGWWARWSRWAVSMRVAVPDIFMLSPLPTYGGQTLNIVLMLYGLVKRKSAFVLPFFASWGIVWLYASITRIWREALFAPISALLNMSGWVYALLGRPKQLKWRGTVISLEDESDRHNISG